MIMHLPAVLLLGILKVLPATSNEAGASPDERHHGHHGASLLHWC